MFQDFFSFLCGFLYLNGFIQLIYNSLFISDFDRIPLFRILSVISIDFAVELYFDFMYGQNYFQLFNFYNLKKDTG